MTYRKVKETVPLEHPPIYATRTCKDCSYTWVPRIEHPKHCPYCKAWLCRQQGETPNEQQ
jgi:predicted Zn-ribbon and HTH transcriptional regulator